MTLPPSQSPLSHDVSSDNAQDTDRALSQVIGYSLLIGIVFLAISSIAAGGGYGALQDLQQEPREQNAQQSMAQFASEASAVGHGRAQRREVSIGPRSPATRRVEPSQGTLKIKVNPEDGPQRTVFESELGRVVYDTGDTQVAYQGGGVWQSVGDSSVMLSEPNFYYRGTGSASETLTLSLVSLTGPDRVVGQDVTISDANTSQDAYTVGGNGSALVGSQVYVVVESEYSDAWADYLSERTPAAVTQTGNTVNATIRYEADTLSPAQGLKTTARTSLTLDNGEVFRVDSYHSGAKTVNGEGDVFFAGDVQIKSDVSEFTTFGEFNARSIDVKSNAESKVNTFGRNEHGGISETTQISGKISDVTQTVYNRNVQANGTTISSVDIDGGSEIVSQPAVINGDVSVSSSGTFLIESDGGSGPMTVKINGAMKAGETSTIKVDASNRDVDIYATGLTLDSGDIEVVGNNDVRLIVNGDTSITDNSDVTATGPASLQTFISGDTAIKSGSTVKAANKESTDMWMFVDGSFQTDSDSPMELTGVFYAPGSDVDLDATMTVNGALVTGGLDFDDQPLRINYDAALEDADPFGDTPDGEVAYVIYIHASEQPVRVS